MSEDSEWNALVCPNGHPMTKEHQAYQVWHCPQCNYHDSWGDQAEKVPVKGSNRTTINGITVVYNNEWGGYQYTVTQEPPR